MTREEIEAACERLRRGSDVVVFTDSSDDDSPYLDGSPHEFLDDVHTLLLAHAERQRRIEAAAEEIEKHVVNILLRNGTDMRRNRIVITLDMRDIITRHLDGETT